MSLSPALVMNTIGESTEGWFLASSFPWFRLQISRLPVQLWNKPVQLMERQKAHGRGHHVLRQTRTAWSLKPSTHQKKQLMVSELVRVHGVMSQSCTHNILFITETCWKLRLDQTGWHLLVYLSCAKRKGTIIHFKIFLNIVCQHPVKV